MENRICISVGKTSARETLTQIRAAEALADVIEVRLDLVENPSVSAFLQSTETPLLFTNRAAWEGGNFAGEEDARIAPLLEAVIGGCAYVDLELNAPERSWMRVSQAAEGTETKVIASWHNFSATPTERELAGYLVAMKAHGADIGKISAMARDKSDVLRMLALLVQAAELQFPLILICMGQAGVISRVAATALGGYMTYCAAEDGAATAPGQVKGSVLRNIYTQLGLQNED